jgi:hypothetical protein
MEIPTPMKLGKGRNCFNPAAAAADDDDDIL